MSFWEDQARNKAEEVEGMYRQAVELSFKLGKSLAEWRTMLHESTSPDPKAYPPCIYSTYMMKEYPVYQFSYQGMLPLYLKDKQYTNQIKDYYTKATLEATVAFQTEGPALKSAFIYTCHFFENLMIRDLDNRNRSAIINAIRYAGFIKDDSWKEIETMESGFLDVGRKNHVQVFVTPSQNTLKLIENVREKYRAGHDFSGMFEPDKHPL
ncbi:hypothetical protein [Paenibacillus senegalimassiliensis]|uniref:hypothetical protein n=1 Tax=Paenibacillus senegalimassiliensis TaxID=1737426 RepID=UPI00073F3EAE|nr:hypothetical protein [Paenibacillus senegalimassiliensis]